MGMMEMSSRPRPVGDKNAPWFDARVVKNRAKAKQARAARRKSRK